MSDPRDLDTYADAWADAVDDAKDWYCPACEAPLDGWPDCCPGCGAYLYEEDMHADEDPNPEGTLPF